jgi:hypothetical protein
MNKETNMTAEQPPVETLRAGRYVKSSYSPEQQNCVMLSATDGWVGVQDSKMYSRTPRNERPILAFPDGGFAAFLEGTKAGELDHPIM